MVAPLALLALGRALRRPTRRDALELSIALGLGCLLLLVAYAGYAAVRAGDPTFRLRSIFPFPGTTPIRFRGLDTLLGSRTPVGVPAGALVLIVLGTIALALRRPRRSTSLWAHGAFWMVVGTLISIRPAYGVNQEIVRLPHAFLGEWLPIYEVLRFPVRLGVAGLMGLALLAGAAAVECIACLATVPALVRSQTRQRLAAATATCLMVGMLLPISPLGVPLGPWGRSVPRPYPIAPALGRDAPLMDELLAGDGPLLELPVGNPHAQGRRALTAPRTHGRAMYRSIYHGRPILNGFHGYWPRGFLDRMRLARALRDATALATLRRTTGLTQILVHAADMPTAEAERWLRLADTGGRDDLRLVARDGPDLLWSVEPAR